MLSYLSLSAISYIFGIFAFDFLGNYILLLATIVLLFLIFVLTFKNIRKYLFFGALFLALGVLGSAYFSNPKHSPLFPLEDKYVTLEGYVTETPVKYNDLYQVKFKVTSASYLGKVYEMNETIRVSSNDAVNFGDTLKLRGFLKRIPKRLNSTDFDSARYYKSRGIFYKLYAREMEDLGHTPRTLEISYWGNFIKDQIQKTIDKNFRGDDGAILKAIATGDKRQFSSDFQGLMLSSGVMKFFYPSFLHIQILSMLVALTVRFFNKKKRDFILVALLLLYAGFNSASPVFTKNSLMVIVAIYSLKKRGYTFHSDILSVTILAILFTNPLYVFDTGFVISTATGLIYYYYKNILHSALSFIPWNKLRKFLVFYITTTFLMLPIICYYFNGISLLVNLLSPIYVIVVTTLLFLIYIMCTLFAIFNSPLFIKPIISGLLWFFKDLPEIINGIPFSKVYIGTPSISVMIAILITLYIIYQIYHRDLNRTVNICACIICITLFGTSLYQYITALGSFDITFVNVGQGDATVIDIKGGDTIIIDGGGKYEFSDYDFGEKVFTPYLADNGYYKINKAIVTHYHDDHCLGVIHALKNYRVSEIIMPDISPENIRRTEIETLAKAKNIPITYAKSGDVFTLSNSAILRVHSPSSEEIQAGDENDSSLVIELEYKGFSALFTGDISKSIEEKIAPKIGDCDVLKMAHHGSANSNSRVFAESISPEYAIASVGENNIYGFPKAEAIYNIQQSGAKVLTTAQNGDITVRVNKNGKYEVFINK